VPREEAPRWPELSLAVIWPQLAIDPLIMEYFPERMPEGKNPPREFLWGILFALRPDFCQRLIHEAAEKRAAAKKQKPDTATIMNLGISKEWIKILLAEPYVSRKYQAAAL